MADSKKTERMHILMDKPFREMIAKAAHESWMSVGEYIREVVALMKGASFDSVADYIIIGREIGREGFEQLTEAAERKNISIKQLCDSLYKRKIEPEEVQPVIFVEPDSEQISLF